MFLQSNLSVNPAGHLALAGVDTVALAARYGTPLYVMDEDMLRERMRTYVRVMAEAFPAGGMPFLASKALSFKEIYRIAQSEGMGTDIVSAGELYTALAAGFDPARMCFHGSAKTAAEIRYALDSGVGCFVVDNADELACVDAYAREKGMRQRILLRVTPGIDPHTFAAVNTGTSSSKFGAALQTGQAMAITRAALGLESVRLAGFHCHIGSQIMEPGPFCDAADVMVAFMADVRRELGYTAEVLNLGGGIGVPYTAEDPAVDCAGILRAVGRHLRDACARADYPAPTVWLEPGRSVVAAAGITLYTVENVKEIPGYKNYIAVDGGMTDNPRYALYGSQYTAVVANRAGEEPDYTASLAGRCCESGDLLGEDMRLQRAQAGDTVAVLVTGAYNYSMASNYNRVPRPPVVLLRGGRDRLAVRRETLEDLAALDV